MAPITTEAANKWRWWTCATANDNEEASANDEAEHTIERRDGEVHRAIAAVVLHLFEQDQPRRNRLERAARLYGVGVRFGSWTPPSGDGAGALVLNGIRTLVNTASSTVVDKPPPRPFFVTDDGDYELQQRASAMTKLASGVLYETNFDAHARADSLLAALTGKVGVKIYERDGKPQIDHVSPWTVLVDAVDGAEGKPRSLYQLAWYDREQLRALYPDVDADTIDDARGAGIDDPWGSDTTLDQVCVLEAWHLPSCAKAGDGRHVLCTDAGVLVDEEWTDDDFGFAWLEWQKGVGEFWGSGIADEGWPIQYEINLVVQRARQAMMLGAVLRIFLERGSKTTTAPFTTDMASTHYYTGRPPIVDAPRAIPPDFWQWLEFWWGKLFETFGISQLQAAALKPQGLDSGKSQLVYADLTSGRMSGWSRNWQDYYCDVAKMLVRLMRRIAKKNPNAEVTYLDPRRRKLERIRWQDADLEEDSYALQCFPISSLPSTPAGRFAQLDDWRRGGIIDDYEYRRLLDLPDLQGSLSLQNAPRELVEQACEEMLYAQDPPDFRPEPFDNLALSRQVATLHLLHARVRRVPEQRLQLVRTYINRIDALMEPPPQPPTPPGPPAGAPPDGMAPPGAATPAPGPAPAMAA